LNTRKKKICRKYNALVLAGNRLSVDPVAEFAGTSCKAMVRVAGMPMIERVIGTLLASGIVGKIIVCLPQGMLLDKDAPQLLHWLKEGVVQQVAPAATPSQSVLQVLEHNVLGYPLLVTTADHPLLSKDIIQHFIEGVEQHAPADVLAALLPRRIMDEKYPQSRRTRLKFRGGQYLGCNLFMLNSSSAISVVTFWQQVETLRKQPWKMMRLLGIRPLAFYLLGLLSLQSALRHLGRRTRTKLGVVMLDQAEAAIDVDTVADLQLVSTILGEKNGEFTS
jgi:GTP:adenosylcobinamide-phosphate guanylyltransferase